jgi:XRE family transcriptional regulator, aerobic/anaerobic benzoate catabolism transcriptional regulator
MQQDDIARAIGKRVRDARAQRGLSRKSLAASAGVSERYLHQLETGTANASVGILVRVAEALRLDFAFLVVGIEGVTSVEAITDSEQSELETKSARRAPAITQTPLAILLAGLSATEQQAVWPVVERFIGERRRSSRGIALLGLRGAGKSTLGRLVSQRFDLPFLSITQEIEARAGMGINDLFNLGGADAYRALENDVAADLSRRTDRIILETAGGIAGNGEALETVLASFKTVWLKASPEDHLARVAGQGDLRPMQGNSRALEHLKALLVQRESEYARAEFTIDTSGHTPLESLAELEAIMAPLLRSR